ncbi:condensation domain-containing protein [Streptomyces sp. NPDC057638]|uniref:condensation domain-containing protein n=1 Tax=Streptomyces sp. NPDC057638 TaxID=3346190 RepID=UPI0036CE9FE4
MSRPAPEATPAPARTVPVRFLAAVDPAADGTAGEPAPDTFEAPLTWSQRYYLAEVDAARAHGRGLNIPRLYRLRPGTSETGTADALRELVERYEVLRSRVVRGEAGGAHQRVHRRGALHLAVHEVPAGTAGERARTVLDALTAPPLDVTECWPLRAALVTEEGRARYLALAFSHVAVDAYALVPVSAHLVGRIAEADPVARSAPAPDGPARGPREQAAAEESPAGERAVQRALRLAEHAYRHMPPAPGPAPEAAPEPAPGPAPEPAPGPAAGFQAAAAATGASARSTAPAPAEPRYRFLRYRSPALDLAVGAVAARTGQSPAAVLTAAMVALDAVRTGPVPDDDGTGLTRYGSVQLISANRLRPGTAAAVLPLSQPVPCCVDTAGADFHELVRRTAVASLRAFRAGGAPPGRLAALLRTVAEERGVRVDATPTLNYRPRSTALPVRPTTAAELAAAADRARAEWTDADPWRASHYLSADVDADGIRLLLQADTAVHPPEWAERWTTALERLLCAAALDPHCPALPAPGAFPTG